LINRGINNPRQHQSSNDLAENWVVTTGKYVNGRITATVPKLTDFDPENLGYLVDVALNGQQFTGKPVNFRYYDVTITSIEPPIGPSGGGTNITIKGRGIYDAGVKKIRILTKDGKGKREVTADWDKKLRCMRVTVPAYNWLFAEQEEEKEEPDVKSPRSITGDDSTIVNVVNVEKKKAPLVKQTVDIKMSLNNQEWFDALTFSYHDSEVGHISYLKELGPPDASHDDKEALWNAEEPEE